MPNAFQLLRSYRYFPKGTIKSMADAFATIGLSAEEAEITVSWLTTGLSDAEKETMLTRSRTIGTVTMASDLDKEFRRSVSGINGGLEATWIPAESKMAPREDPHPDEDVLIVKETYEQSAKRKQLLDEKKD